MVSIVSEKKQLENGDCSPEVCLLKYKRRKVSAVRHFPVGCGPKIAHTTMQKNEVECDVQKMGELSKELEFSREQGDDLRDVEGKDILGKIVDSKSFDGLNCSSNSQRAISSLPNSKNDGHASEELQNLHVDHRSNDLLKEPISEDLKSSQDLENMEYGSMTKHETCETAEDLTVARVELRTVLVDTMKKAGNDIQSEDAVGGSKKRKYPPRRRVSAVRDFPPLCGPNVLVEAENIPLDQADGNTCNVLVSVNQAENNFEADDFVRYKVKEVDFEKDARVVSKVSQSGKCTGIKGQEICIVKDGEQHERLMKEEFNGENQGVGVNRTVIVKAKDTHKEKSGDVSSNDVELVEESNEGVQNANNLLVVQALMAAPRRLKKVAVKSALPTSTIKRPLKQGNETAKSSPSSTAIEQSERKKHDPAVQDKSNFSTDKSKVHLDNSKKRSKMAKVCVKETDLKEVSGVNDEGDNSEYEDLPNDILLLEEGTADITLLPRGVGSSSEKGVRSNVREVLRLFQAVVRKLLQGEETKTRGKTKSKDQENAKRIDLRAAQILKSHGKCVNTGKNFILGPIPGVEVGDFFHYRMELSMIGLHRPPQGGIDYIKQRNKIIATSIVASGGYANDVDSSDVLIYTGQGGTKVGDKLPEDQKLERGNLALRNSMDEKNVVRVIRGFKETKPSETDDGKPKTVATYTYDGLYTVEKFWQDLGPHGKLVYRFELRRLPGQPELAWKEVTRSKKFKVREGKCVDDISGGKETIPICAINTIDDEKPPIFTYITDMMYPDWCQPIPPRGCDCKDGCSDSGHCACAVKNGGEIPYNYNGAIVEARPLVYECGPSCKCSSTCHNRVSQSGIKFPLEIFKTDSRGWGVRSLSSIPSGSFICQYIGELLDDREAEQRAGSDEYLFDIGQNYNDTNLWDGLSALMPDVQSSSGDAVEDVGFTIDAANYGNIGRFINHSCTPNLYAQNVLYDHDDRRIPHIMLFAAENIPPLQELTYHYNYVLDQVFDSNGNIKKKSCYCGSSECSGRMY